MENVPTHRHPVNPETNGRAAQTVNRISAAFAKQERTIAERLRSGLTDQIAIDRTNRALDMDTQEYCTFQDLKSGAHLDGTLSIAEAQTVYACLGETPETFNRQPVHVKAVLTQVFQDLLSARIAAKRSA